MRRGHPAHPLPTETRQMTLPDLIDLLGDIREARYQAERARALAGFFSAIG